MLFDLCNALFLKLLEILELELSLNLFELCFAQGLIKAKYREILYKPKYIIFIPLSLVFYYILCVSWVNNLVFHDLCVKYRLRTKNLQKRGKTTPKAKWKITFFESLINSKHERSNFEILMISRLL